MRLIVDKFKICSICKLKKESKEFNKYKRGKHIGLSSVCITCHKLHTVRTCIDCGAVRPISEFHRNSHKKSGYTKRCELCHMTRRKLNKSISNGIYSALKENKAGRHWEILVGWTLEDLKKDFETKYYNGMTFNSFATGKVDIHHIKEKYTFKFKNVEDPEFKACWALSNLKPMWHIDHVKLHGLKV